MSPGPASTHLTLDRESYEPRLENGLKVNDLLKHNETKGIFPTQPTFTVLSDVSKVDTITTTSSYLQPQVSSTVSQMNLQRLYTIRLQQLQAQTLARNMMNMTPTRKQYSQADLDAAVQDIRSGRIGTRRASVVYGIPRSTLRNKIYKLDGLSGRRSLGSVEENSCTPMPIQFNAQPTSSTVFPMTSQPVRPDISQLYYHQMVARHPSSVVGASPQANYNVLQALLLRQIYANSSAMEKNGALPSVSTASLQGHSQIHVEGEVKATRPKRGQYRRYEKSALERAVQAVRSGEMSVHRAGSFFGVPHSTLEYKVKERARKPVQQQSNSFDSDNSDTMSSTCNIFPTNTVFNVNPNVMLMDPIRLQALNEHFRRMLSTLALNTMPNMGVVTNMQ